MRKLKLREVNKFIRANKQLTAQPHQHTLMSNFTDAQQYFMDSGQNQPTYEGCESSLSLKFKITVFLCGYKTPHKAFISLAFSKYSTIMLASFKNTGMASA